ncbi:MAG: sugar transferase [Eubacteriales bacterium]|nr:sugar transferase [Eubacteriales bacterium]
MILRAFEKLPEEFRNDEVKRYYDILYKKRKSLVFKRITDIIISLFMIVLLLLPMLIIAILIKCTSKGPVLYKQERVTIYGKKFRILKFRSMQVGSDSCGELLTYKNDNRITKIGRVLRKLRLDELPQIFHVFTGKMSIVGTRPEVTKYVECYTPVMYATLLMPAGITSLASIKYKDEDRIIGEVDDPKKIDEIYTTEILPQKMKYNLKYIERFGFRRDMYLMMKTVKQVLF